MLDKYIRKYIDLPLDLVVSTFSFDKISANNVTIIGFIIGVISAIFFYFEQTYFAVIFLILNRICDGLDGAVARKNGATNFGGFLDITMDFIFYSLIVFVSAMRNPSDSIYACFLLFSFIGTITSFLAFAIIAAKKNISSNARGEKSFFYLGGICEGSETAITLVLICIFVEYLAIIAVIYGILCWITTLGRIYQAKMMINS